MQYCTCSRRVQIVVSLESINLSLTPLQYVFAAFHRGCFNIDERLASHLLIILGGVTADWWAIAFFGMICQSKTAEWGILRWCQLWCEIKQLKSGMGLLTAYWYVDKRGWKERSAFPKYFNQTRRAKTGIDWITASTCSASTSVSSLIVATWALVMHNSSCGFVNEVYWSADIWICWLIVKTKKWISIVANALL